MSVKVLETKYVLAVKDLRKSSEYYQTKLGFTMQWQDGNNWHCLARSGIVVMLGECSDDRAAWETDNHSYFAYINIENIDELYNELTSKGCDIPSKIANKPWGLREFCVRTIDGHRMMFGQALKEG